MTSLREGETGSEAHLIRAFCFSTLVFAASQSSI